MGWIIKDSRGKFIYKWREGGRVLSLTMRGITTRRGAEKQAKEWNGELTEFGRRQASTPIWTLEIAKMKVLESRDYSPRHQKNMEAYWDSVFDHFGTNRHIDTITKADVMGWIQGLKQTEKWRGGDTRRMQRDAGTRVKNTTIRHYVHAMSKAMDLAMEYDVLDRNPCRSINLSRILPDDTSSRDRRLSEDEFRLLLDNTASEHTRRFLILAWGTGARMREITGLEWTDIDQAAGTVTFRHQPDKGKRTKNSKERTVHVAESIIAYICDDSLIERSTWVFSHSDGRRMEDLKKSIRRTAERAKIKGVTSHVIRHSVGSLLAEGLDLVVVRDHLGHSDLRITSRYLHGSDDKRKTAAERLGHTIEVMGSGSEKVVPLPTNKRICGAES